MELERTINHVYHDNFKKSRTVLSKVNIHFILIQNSKLMSMDCRDSIERAPDHCVDINLAKNLFKPFSSLGSCFIVMIF